MRGRRKIDFPFEYIIHLFGELGYASKTTKDSLYYEKEFVTTDYSSDKKDYTCKYIYNDDLEAVVFVYKRRFKVKDTYHGICQWIKVGGQVHPLKKPIKINRDSSWYDMLKELTSNIYSKSRYILSSK